MRHGVRSMNNNRDSRVHTKLSQSVKNGKNEVYKRPDNTSKTCSESVDGLRTMKTIHKTTTDLVEYTLPYKMKYWKCNLCNIELPDDELATIRKQRHREFHIDESIGTHKRRRNWTFGEVDYVLT